VCWRRHRAGVESFAVPAVLFDCSSVEAAPQTIEAALALGVPLVLATSGVDWSSHPVALAAATQIPLVIASNLTRGHALMMRMARLLAGEQPGARVTVVDRHPPTKKDAPSATAFQLAGACGTDNIVCLRSGVPVADHQLVLAWPGETLEITHRVTSMDAPVQGALAALERAARLTRPGLYCLDSPELAAHVEGAGA
jgi:4-hydroxy-tetrahydrodipicolinate reductase